MVDFGGFINGVQNSLGAMTGTYAWCRLKNDTKFDIYVGYMTCTDWIYPGATKKIELTAGTHVKVQFKGNSSGDAYKV